MSNNPDVINGTPSFDLEATLGEQPVKLSDVLAAMGMPTVQIPAKELIDHTFTIYKAKPFGSAFEGQEDPWYIVAVDMDSGEKFSSVLGGQTVTEILKNYVNAGLRSPLTVTLRFKTGGKFGGYYYLE